MSSLTLTRETDPSPADIEVLGAGLSAHATPILGSSGFEPVAVFARDVDGDIHGGVYGRINWEWLHVSLLWVNDERRGTGLGSELMTEIETLAIDRGCDKAHLDTFSYQAKPFYERLGYEVFAELLDYPHGHSRIFLRKTLT